MTTAPTDPAPRAPAARRSLLRTAVQLLGFIAGLGLLWWCVGSAIKPENRAQWAKLGQASWQDAATLMALAAISLILNGTVFWLALRPVRKLPYADVIAANAIATLLALVPFKLSMLFRLVIHRVRNGVPMLTGGAWLAAAAALILGGVAPFLIAGAWRVHEHAGLDAKWAAAVLGGLLVIGGAMVVTGRLLTTQRGWAIVERIASRFPGKKLHAVLLPRAHEGARMVADWRTVAGAMACRAVDIAVQTARFTIAARIVGLELSLDQAVIGASAYFLIGAAAPTGSLGTREQGTTAIFKYLLGSGPPNVVVLLVTATDTLIVLAAAALAAAWLRVDRLLAGKFRPRQESPERQLGERLEQVSR